MVLFLRRRQPRKLHMTRSTSSSSGRCGRRRAERSLLRVTARLRCEIILQAQLLRACSWLQPTGESLGDDAVLHMPLQGQKDATSPQRANDVGKACEADAEAAGLGHRGDGQVPHGVDVVAGLVALRLLPLTKCAAIIAPAPSKRLNRSPADTKSVTMLPPYCSKCRATSSAGVQRAPIP